jgi:hypothetical protein
MLTIQIETARPSPPKSANKEDTLANCQNVSPSFSLVFHFSVDVPKRVKKLNNHPPNMLTTLHGPHSL